MGKQNKLPRGLGAIRKTKSGFRLEKYHVFPDKITKQRLSVNGTDVQECLAKMADLEREEDERFENERNMTNIAYMTVPKAAMLWLRNEKKNNVKPSTYDRIERTINNQILGYDIGLMVVKDVTTEDITKHLDKLQEKYSYSVISKTFDFLNQFFSYATPKGNPMEKLSKPPRNAHGILSEEDEDLFGNSHMADMVLSDEEIKTFKEFVNQPPKVGSKGRSRYGLLYYFTLLTFLRSGEVRALKWKDIDFENKRLQVTKTVSRVVDRSKDDRKTNLLVTTPKTARGRRIVMMTDEAVETIEKYYKTTSHNKPDDFVFCTDSGKPITEGQTARTLKGILKAAKLEREGFSMHYLRHSGISYYLRHGVPIDVISKMAGHSSTEVTRRIYYHINNTQERDALEMMNKI